MADLQSVSRILYEISGTIQILEDEGTTYLVKTGADLADIGEYMITGPFAKEKGNIDPIYQDFPQLVILSEAGSSKPVPVNEVFWKPYSKGAQWTQTPKNRYGITELAHIQDHNIYYKRRIGILPSEFKVEIQPVSIESGNISLSNIQGALIGIMNEEADFRSEIIEMDKEKSNIYFHALNDLPPSKVKIKLNWLEGGEIIIEVPFPTQGSCFTDSNGNRIPQNRKIVIDQLYGVEALTVSQNENEKSSLIGHCSCQGLSRRLQNAIYINEQFNREYRLITLKPRFLQIFSATDNLDAEIRLTLQGRGRDSSTLRISRFDIDLDFSFEKDTVHLSLESQKKFEMKDLETINLFAMPIADPFFEPVLLEQNKLAGLLTGTWDFNSQEKTSGAWMVFGHFNGAYHIRPRRWDVKGNKGNEESYDTYQIPDSLLRAIAIPNDNERRRAYKVRFDEIVKDPNHSDWDSIIQYIYRYQDLPLVSLDLFYEMVQHNELMAMLLLKYASTEFDRIWAFREELPFSWLTLPFDDWVKAADTFHFNFNEKLAGLTEDQRKPIIRSSFEAFFINLTEDKKPFDYMVEVLTKRYFEKGKVKARKSQEEYAQIVQLSIHMQHEDLIRKHSDDTWPPGPNFKQFIMQHCPDHLSLFDNVNLKVTFRNGVLTAPIFAAIVSIEGLEIQKEQIFAVKFLRDFDKEWFDSTYHLSLALAKALSSK